MTDHEGETGTELPRWYAYHCVTGPHRLPEGPYEDVITCANCHAPTWCVRGKEHMPLDLRADETQTERVVRLALRAGRFKAERDRLTALCEREGIDWRPEIEMAEDA